MKTPASGDGGPLHALWIDVKASVQVAQTPAVFQERCQIYRAQAFDAHAVKSLDPDFVIVEFDYPSRASMEQAGRFKADHSNVPMVAITVQHSETLAVWFFRRKFIDFLVQPVSVDEAIHCLNEIAKITRLRRKQQPRSIVDTSSAVPLEVSHGNGVVQPMLPALSLVAGSYHEQLTVTRAAEACNMLPFKFGREFKEQFGIDFRDYVVRYRIREACRLLRNPNAHISEIAYAVGFSEPSYFTKTFKRLVGSTPSEVLGDQDLDFEVNVGSYQNSMLSS